MTKIHDYVIISVVSRYDRGNLVLTDHEYKILNILRPRVAGEEKFLVRETYPLDLCKTELPTVDTGKLHDLVLNAKENDTLKKGMSSALA